MIRVAALTGGHNDPSARFRVRQHILPLQPWQVEVAEYIPAIEKYAQLPGHTYKGRPEYGNPFYYAWQGVKLAARAPGLLGSWRAQITWLGRLFLDGAVTLEFLVKKPLIFDVDDAIYLMHPWGAPAARWAARRAEVVIAGNEYLADWFSSCSRRVEIIPTAVDTARFFPRSPKVSGSSAHLVVGWTGLKANLPYLEAIAQPLGQFLRLCREAVILVVCDAPPQMPGIPPERMRFLPWSPENEAAAIRLMDVGLMPLPDNAWTRGKCSYKMLQYMATGIPVVVSPVGMNKQVLNLGPSGLAAQQDADWYEALRFLHNNGEKARNYGRGGRKVVQENFSLQVITPKLAKIFRTLL